MSWTLKYYDSTDTLQTVTFAALAVLEGGKVIADAWTLHFQSHKASTVTLRLPGVPPHVAPAIPFESRIQIIDPTGTVQFAGYRTDRSGTADPNRTSSQYTFEDDWYFLEHCPYHQMWVRQVGGASSNVPFPAVVLYQPNPGQTYTPAPVAGVITVGQQITDILNWAISRGAQLQIGEIDPDLYEAWYPLQNAKCADAIRHCLRLSPDCFTEIDYTTTPPTFNARQRGNLTAVTLPYAYTDSAGRRHIATDITSRPELQPKRVALFYRVVSGSALVSTPVDIWPNSNLSVQGPVITGQDVGGSAAPYTAGGTPVVGTAMTGITGSGVMTIPVGAPGGLRALDYAIDLSGPKQTISTAAITTAAFDPTNLNWWRNKVPSLRQVSEGGTIPNDGSTGALTLLSASINTGGPQDISVTQDAPGGIGAYINLTTFAYELLPTSAPMSWMTAVPGGGALEVAEAIVTVHFSYSRQKAVGTGTLENSQVNDHVHHVRVKLCNSETATGSYSQTISTGEAVPPNLAETVYNSLAPLQYSFSHTLVEYPFNGFLKPGKHAVNLGGTAALAAWTTMAATLQQSEYKLHLDGGGNTYDNATIRCGPVEHLEPGQLIQLFNVFANRDLSKIDPQERLNGAAAPGNTVAAASDTAQENSVPGVPDQALQSFTAPDGVQTGITQSITVNPATGQATVAQLNSATGAQLSSAIIMAELSGSGAPGAGTLA
jgi:hypothetical protein